MGGSMSGGIAGKERLASGPSKSALVGAFILLLLLVVPATASALPDGRRYEQVSPVDKKGGSVLPVGLGTEGLIGGDVQASEDGQSLAFVADAPVEAKPEGNRANESSQILARRSSSPPAWSSKDIVTPAYHAEGLNNGNAQEYHFFSTDLNTAVLEPFGLITRPFMEPPLVSGESSEERGVYERANAVCEATQAGCYQALVSPANETVSPPNPYGGQLRLLGASPDATHVVIGSQVALTSGASSEEPLIYESNAQAPAAEQLELVSLLPNGTLAKEAEFGGEEGEEVRSARGAVSSDGSRVFFTGVGETLENGKHEELGAPPRYLYMRDTSSGTTIRLDVPVEAGVKEPTSSKPLENRRVHFQVATADGSRIFFTSNAKLTAQSNVKPEEQQESAGRGPVNLYVCEIPASVTITPGTKCQLHDLTAALTFKNAGIGDAVGEVSAISADGSTVYFAANGALEGGVTGTCPNPSDAKAFEQKQRCNLYVEHFNGSWEPPKLVAVLTGKDAPSFGGGGSELWNLTARSSPDGNYFAFMSENAEELFGYDNHDLSPLAKGAADEEVFLYERNAGKIIACPSCNPDKSQRPTGIFDEREAGEGVGPLVDPAAAVWKERWIAGSIPGWTAISLHEAPYQSRYLSDNGRLYFMSADKLVPHKFEQREETIHVAIPKKTETEQQQFEVTGTTPVGVENVYQWEPEKVGSCEAGTVGCVSLISSGTSPHESAFLDASASGEDVFFLTDAKLAPTDNDESLDAYDARVCSQSPGGCVEPPPPPPSHCTGESCKSIGPSTSPSFQPAASSTYSGPGNAPKVEVLGSTSTKPRPLTRAQKLAKALAACRKKYKHSRHRRQVCERQARRAYGAKRASTKGKR